MLICLLVFGSLLGFLLISVTAQAHGHGHAHQHTAATQSKATWAAHADDHATAEEVPRDDGHGHHHSGDPLKDLLTLGHNHVGGTCPGLPPALWLVAAAPQVAQVLTAWPWCAPGDSPPDNPFRPPIA